MKTTKRLISIILCIAMILSLGTINSFALEIGDEIVLENEFSVYETYPFFGDLSEGTNYIDFERTEDFIIKHCYNFTAEKDGYYMITADTDLLLDIGVASYYTQKRSYDYFVHSNGTKSCYIYKLSEGSFPVIFKFNPDYFSQTLEISIDYYAESITDMKYDRNEINNIIIGEVIFLGSYCTYCIHNDYTVTFSNGESITCNYSDSSPIRVDSVSPWAEGENAVTVSLHDYTENDIATTRKITDFIEKIEIPGIDKYLIAKKYYNGYTHDYDFSYVPEEVIITYTDGTTATFSYYYDIETNDEEHLYIPLSTGVSVWMYGDQEIDEATGKVYFYVAIADHEYILEECAIEQLSFDDNLAILKSTTANMIKTHFDEFSFYLEMLAYGALSPEIFSFFLKQVTGINLLKMLVSEISAFVGYCFFSV